MKCYLHSRQSDGLLQPLLEVVVDLGQLPLLLAKLVRAGLHVLKLQVEARQLILYLELLLGDSLQVLAAKKELNRTF